MNLGLDISIYREILPSAGVYLMVKFLFEMKVLKRNFD